jgi:chromosomal replication initiation ATPase DnaA
MTPREKNLTIIDYIASGTEFTRDDILGRRKFPDLVAVRRNCVMAFRNMGYSTLQIGRIMNRDHSTIVHAIQQHAKREAANDKQ